MDVQVFSNPDFGKVRVAEVDGEPMFCLLDVAKALDYVNPAKAVIDHCKGVSILETPSTNQHGAVVMQNIKFGKESEVYRLIMRAKTERAEQFQDWVCAEVLPSIRKHGAYMTPATIEKTLSDPDFIIQLATRLKTEQQLRLKLQEENTQLESENESLCIENDLLNTEIERTQPMVDFAYAVANSDSLITVSDLAKLICQNGVNIGGKRLFEWLRTNGYLCTAKGIGNVPTQRSMNLGLFRVVEYPINTSNGIRLSYTPKVTAKGQIYFLNRLRRQPVPLSE